ncbi:MAG: hypothetical protein AB7O43_03650 [Hyphomicrobiaceae bacterium]
MRRGLISWSKVELPEFVLDRRVAKAQAAMAATGLDALLVYTTPARTAGVSWLAGFVPYWNQGLLVVPHAGPPVLVSALSNRVKGWIQRNAHVAEVRSSPQYAAEAVAVISAAVSKARVGIVDLPHLPAVISHSVADAGHVPVNGTSLFAELRSDADPAEIGLTCRAAEIARRALSRIGPDETDAGRAVAAVEGEARRLGAEEVYPGIAADLKASTRLVRLEGAAKLGTVAAVRASVAYKGAWVRMTRTIARDAAHADAVRRATEQFAAAAARLPDTGALLASKTWLAEGCRTTLPLEALAGSVVDEPLSLTGTPIVSVQATYDVDGMPVLVGAPVLLGRNGAAASLLAVAEP